MLNNVKRENIKIDLLQRRARKGHSPILRSSSLSLKDIRFTYIELLSYKCKHFRSLKNNGIRKYARPNLGYLSQSDEPPFVDTVKIKVGVDGAGHQIGRTVYPRAARSTRPYADNSDEDGLEEKPQLKPNHRRNCSYHQDRLEFESPDGDEDDVEDIASSSLDGGSSHGTASDTTTDHAVTSLRARRTFLGKRYLKRTRNHQAVYHSSAAKHMLSKYINSRTHARCLKNVIKHAKLLSKTEIQRSCMCDLLPQDGRACDVCQAHQGLSENLNLSRDRDQSDKVAQLEVDSLRLDDSIFDLFASPPEAAFCRLTSYTDIVDQLTANSNFRRARKNKKI
jgi:hypothetical protein